MRTSFLEKGQEPLQRTFQVPYIISALNELSCEITLRQPETETEIRISDLFDRCQLRYGSTSKDKHSGQKAYWNAYLETRLGDPRPDFDWGRKTFA